jgi:hypothetical protein
LRKQKEGSPLGLSTTKPAYNMFSIGENHDGNKEMQISQHNGFKMCALAILRGFIFGGLS